MIPIAINEVPVDCINQAAIRYHVPATVILSVMKTEGGKNGSATRNKNGTYDYGVMQINSVWIDTLKPYGYTRNQLQYSPCKNIEAGTWILSQAIANGKTTFKGVGDYHSHTPELNKKYHQKVAYFNNRLNRTLHQ